MTGEDVSTSGAGGASVGMLDSLLSTASEEDEEESSNEVADSVLEDWSDDDASLASDESELLSAASLEDELASGSGRRLSAGGCDDGSSMVGVVTELVDELL